MPDTNPPVTAPVCTLCNETRDLTDMCACGRCYYSACCECWPCDRCHVNYQSGQAPCHNCGTCTTCCRCVTCNTCSIRITAANFHEECETCRNCCGCREGEYVRMFKAPNPIIFHQSKRTQHKANPSKRFIAVEIEVAKCQRGGKKDTTSPAVKEWSGAIVSDGSLPSGGFEINTAPASGDLFVNQISQICEALAKQGGEVNNSCGLHVHVDARDFNFYSIRKLAFLYAKIEDALFGIVAPSRKLSRYCRPCGPQFVRDLEKNILPKDSQKKIVENVYGHNDVNLRDVRHEKYNEARYSAMNVHSWLYRGTIENRMHHGTVRFDKIVPWSLLWASVLDYANEHNENDIKSMKGDPLTVLLNVAPNDNIRTWVINRTKYFKDVQTGVGDAKEDVITRSNY